MRLGNDIVGATALLFRTEEAASLHEPQVLGGHVARNAAGCGKFADRIAAAEEHLHDPQPVGMGERPQAFGRPAELLQAREPGRGGQVLSGDQGVSSGRQPWADLGR